MLFSFLCRVQIAKVMDRAAVAVAVAAAITKEVDGAKVVGSHPGPSVAR